MTSYYIIVDNSCTFADISCAEIPSTQLNDPFMSRKPEGWSYSMMNQFYTLSFLTQSTGVIQSCTDRQRESPQYNTGLCSSIRMLKLLNLVQRITLRLVYFDLLCIHCSCVDVLYKLQNESVDLVNGSVVIMVNVTTIG